MSSEGLIMRIALVVYSETGHTYQVAEQLFQSMRKKHPIALLRITTSSTQPSELLRFTNLTAYDHIIFAFPVQGFTLPDALNEYFHCLSIAASTKVILFTTQFFPWKFLGGNQTHRNFWRRIEPLGAVPMTAERLTIHRSSKEKHEQIAHVISVINHLFDTN